MQFKNLIECNKYFEDKKKATEYLVRLRWNGKPVCVFCGSDKCYELKGANARFKCAKCRKHFSAIKGTIFENSPLSLQKWFCAVYLITSHKKGISSHQLGRDLSISQKSAWFVLQRIRFALQSGSFEHSEPTLIIEIDETYHGGENKNRRKSKRKEGTQGGADKAIIWGAVERGGNITAKVIKDTKAVTLLNTVRGEIKDGAMIFSDEQPGYNSLYQKYYHERVNHSREEYARGIVHTNTIEGAWSLFHRGVIGIYHHISTKHLDKYVDEFEFRYNTRKCGESERFDKMLTLCNRRLTYNELIADNQNDKTRNEEGAPLNFPSGAKEDSPNT